MGRCLFSIIVQDQQSPNYKNGENGEVTGAYVNRRKSETRGEKANKSLTMYHKCREMTGDVPFARGQRH